MSSAQLRIQSITYSTTMEVEFIKGPAAVFRRGKSLYSYSVHFNIYCTEPANQRSKFRQ
jgi:hypothetical protein